MPEAITKSALKQYRDANAITDLVEFAGRGQSLTIDSGWCEVAGACLGWLTQQGLQGHRQPQATMTAPYAGRPVSRSSAKIGRTRDRRAVSRSRWRRR